MNIDPKKSPSPQASTRFNNLIVPHLRSEAYALGLGFTETPPTEQGWYWHCWKSNDGEFSNPIPTSVLVSAGTGKCFVTMGQLGMDQATDCDKYGGWWKKLPEPGVLEALVTHMQSEVNRVAFERIKFLLSVPDGFTPQPFSIPQAVELMKLIEGRTEGDFSRTPFFIKSPREMKIEDLLRSACAIAERCGKTTAWHRFRESCRKLGVNGVTARTYHILESDQE